REIARHVLVVRIDGAAADLEELGVTIEPLDLVLSRVAVAAEDLDGAVGDVLSHRGAEELHAVRVEPMAGPIERHLGCREIGVGASGHELGVALGDVALDLAVLTELLPEALSVTGVSVHDLDAAPGDAEAHGGQPEALELEVPHHAHAGAADLADDVRLGHDTIVEHELGRRRRAHAHLVVNLLAELEARETLLDDDHGERAAWRALDARVDEEDVAELRLADRTVGDPHLRAVQHVGAPLASRRGAE